LAAAGIAGIAVAAGVFTGAGQIGTAQAAPPPPPPPPSQLPPAGPSPGGQIARDWTQPNANLAGTRDVQSRINSGSVSRLGLAWSVPIPGSGEFGNYATSPVIVGGVAYEQNLMSDVQAVDFRTGRVLWTHPFNSPNGGPDGVNVQAGVVYGATNDSAFALDARTGATLWIRRLTRNDHEGIDMAPGFNDNTVYVSTVPVNTSAFYAGNGQAILWAMDARTGATKWQFREVGDDLFGNTAVNSGGGQWQAPTFDAQGNLYLEVGNPAPFVGSSTTVSTTSPDLAFGGSRPGPNLYTNSVVKLDARTGGLIWYDQLTPHDVYDHDLNNQAMLMNVGGREIVISAGKAGIAIANDAQTGRRLWTTPFGEHNGHDDDNIAAMNRDFSRLPDPASTYALFPGVLGGAETPYATDGRLIFIPANDLEGLVTAQLEGAGEDPAVGTGEMVAIDAATGSIVWDHRFAHSPYGGATVSNDLVWTTTFDGQLIALDTRTGNVVYQSTLPAGTNAPVVVEDDTVLTASTIATLPGQTAQILAYRLGADAPPPRGPAGPAAVSGLLPSPIPGAQPLPQGFNLGGWTVR